MNCPLCAREIPQNPTACPNRSPVSAPVSEVMAAPLSPSGARPVNRHSWAFRLGAWVLPVACWYIVMMNLVIIGRYGPLTIEPAERFTRLIAAIFVNFLLPLIGVFLYYRKRVQRPPIHRKVLLVSAFAMVFSFLPHRGSYYSAASLTKDRIGTLAKEGAGLLPASPNQSIWDLPYALILQMLRNSVARTTRKSAN